MKKRRGRQPHQSLVPLTLLEAIKTLTSQLGVPTFLEEEGFRDISGWLKHIRRTQFRHAWLRLCQSYISESESVEDKHHEKLKEDLIQEIMKLVITRLPKESCKVVKTNARRQSKVSKSGQTVRNVFEGYLAELEQKPESSQGGSSQTHAKLQKKKVLTKPAASSSSQGFMIQGSGSSMDISPLLTNSRHPTQRNSSSGSSRLPSMTQFDEEIRVRSQKDGWK